MARRTTRPANGSGEPSVSGFGGHRIAAAGIAAAETEGAVATLATLGYEDAEQLAAAASVPGLADDLKEALGLTDRDFQGLLDSALGVIPADQVERLTHPASVDDLHLGAMEPTDEMIAAAEATVPDAADLAAVPLPAVVNLIPFQSPIRNQASRGTCVAFALSALHEYVLRRAGTVQDLSEQDLYYEAKLVDGNPNGCGTWQAKALLPLASRGQCRESVWPYNPNPPCNNHGARPAQARPDGLRYRQATHAVATRNVAAYKAEMAQQRPVTLSIPVYNSWYQSAETRRSGRITMRVGGEAQVGGHAVCLVGYQDAPASPGGGYFVVRNSWSTSWASQSPYGSGYGTIPYQYVTDEAWEAYSAVVAGAGSEQDDAGAGGSGNGTSVVIEVGPNVTITINAT